MTTKQCGTCEFWDGINKVNGDGRYMGLCLNPELFINTQNMKYMINDEGQDCQVYKKIKEELNK